VLQRQQPSVARVTMTLSLRQQAHGRWCVDRRPRRIRQVEQFSAALSAKRDEPGAQRFEGRQSAGRPDHAWASVAVAGPYAANAGCELLGVGNASFFGFPSHASAVMSQPAGESQVAGVGTCGDGTFKRAAYAIARMSPFNFSA
jgi:hypothetical protein